MSISNSGAQNLTQDEQILHHYAAVIKEDLKAYHAYSSRSKQNWTALFKTRLVRFIPVIQLYTSFGFIQTKAMNFYHEAHKRSPDIAIRVHPLLLSLTSTIDACEENPDISTISEDDERVLRNQYYTSPSALPPLEIHFSGKNGLCLFSNRNGYALTSIDGCRECMESAPQDNSGGEGDTAQGGSAATFHALEDNTAHIGSASPSMHNKGKKRRRAFSGGVGNLSSTRSPKVPAVIRRAKGKWAQKAGSCDANPTSPEETSDTSPQEGRDREVEPRTFTGARVQHFVDNMNC